MDITEQTVTSPTRTQIDRVFLTFVSPAEAFADIARNRVWIIAFAVTVLTSYFFSFTVIEKVGLNQTVENIVSRNATLNRQLQRDTPEQRAAVISVATTLLKVAMVSEPILVLLFNLLLAAVFLISFNLFFNANFQFGTVFSILIFADLINALKPLAAAAVLWFGSAIDQFDFQNPFGSNLEYFLPNVGNGAMKSLLFSLDGFMIWYLVVLAIGFAVAGRMSVSKAAAVVFGWFGVLVVTRIALASVGGT